MSVVRNEYRWVCRNGDCEGQFTGDDGWVAPERYPYYKDTDGVVGEARAHVLETRHGVEVRCREVTDHVITKSEYSLWTFAVGSTPGSSWRD